MSSSSLVEQGTELSRVDKAREAIRTAVSQLQEDLEFAGDPHTGSERKRRAFGEHLPRYAKLVFELAQLVGGTQALKETAENTVMILHKYTNGNESGKEFFRLNVQPEFVAALMEIALENNRSSSEATRSRVTGVFRSALADNVDMG